MQTLNFPVLAPITLKIILNSISFRYNALWCEISIILRCMINFFHVEKFIVHLKERNTKKTLSSLKLPYSYS